MNFKSPSLGLIAGNGMFPIFFAKEARRQGYRVVAAAVRGDTSWFLRFFVNRMQWFRPGELKKLFAYFRRQGIDRVLMAGQIHPRRLFDSSVALDEEFQALFQALKDRKADTIFAAVAERLEKEGLTLLDSTFLMKDAMAPQGTLSRRAPTERELADIEFGRTIAKAMGGLDVGQTVVVKDKAIVAIEAMEGTDRCILRGARIARQGAVVVKMSKPDQDNRFDVPVVGPRTFRFLKRGQASCLAVEAGRTLILDRRRCERLADDAGIAWVAVPPSAEAPSVESSETA